MLNDFQAIVELTDKELNDFLAELIDSSPNNLIEVGSYNPATKNLSLGSRFSYTLQLVPVHNKKLYLLNRRGRSMPAFSSSNVMVGELLNPKVSEHFEFNERIRKPTQVMKQAINVNNLPKLKFVIEEPNEKGFSIKMEPEELRYILFQMFTAKEKMYFDEIQEVVDQPRGYLQSTLDEICCKKKDRNKFVYSLKPVYSQQASSMSKLPKKKVKTL